MAGVGFVLRRLVRTDGLSAKLSGLGHATMASSGPWLITCVALIAIAAISDGRIDSNILRQFSILVTYNFSFSLVGSGAVVIVVTRRLADCIYARDLSKVPALLVGATIIIFALMSIIGIIIYGYVIDLTLSERILGFTGLLLTGGVWLTTAFISALKNYLVITSAFVLGMLVALIAALVLAQPFGLSGLLAGVSFGLGTIFFLLLARITIEFPGSTDQPFAFLKNSNHLWQLALAGLMINAAIWVDKWVMWFAPGATNLGNSLYSHEAYEAGMFLAYLSIVPSLALLLIDLETAFFERYTNFYRSIREHATLSQLREQHSDIKRILIIGLKRIALLQTAVCLIAIVLAPTIVTAVGGGAEMIPILRYGLIGALFHILLIATMTVLAYFDLRHELLLVSCLFFLSCLGFTFVSVQIGAEFYGYGYYIAALISFCAAFYFASKRVNQLLFQTFVANNQTLREQSNK
jgi:polysaccharide biosynthesis protein PelG